MWPSDASSSSSSPPSGSEDTTTSDLGGFFQRGGRITPRTESGYSEWIAVQSASRVLTSIGSRRNEADGAQGLGLWRPPLNPALPDSNI